MMMLEIALPIKLTNSNAGRGFAHWRSTKERIAIEQQLLARGFRRKPFDHPVRVEVIRILGKSERLWDSSSVLRGNWKEIEDSLVAIGWFHDDGPKWITHTSGFQDASQRDIGPAILVRIFREDDQGPGDFCRLVDHMQGVWCEELKEAILSRSK